MPTPPRHSAADGYLRSMPLTNVFRDSHGDLKIAQWPNPSIAAAAVLGLASEVVDSRPTVLRDAALGAFIAWASDEVVRGASLFRRALGAAALGYALYALSGR